MANFYTRYLQSVARWPDGTAVEWQRQSSQQRERYTFSALRRMSDGVAHWLAPQVAEKGRLHCALLAANSPRWLVTFMGTLATGAVVVPLDTALNHEQVRKLLMVSDSSLLFADAKHAAVARKAIEGLSIELVLLDSAERQGERSLEAAFRGTDEQFAPAETADEDVAAILYSSGTTGDPKGVMLTHDNFLAETESIFRVFSIGPGDSILGVLPLFHAFALAVNILLPMAGGATTVFLESLNTTDLVKALPTVNIFPCVPQFFYLIHDRIWKEVRAKGSLAVAAYRSMLFLARVGQKVGLNPGKLFFRPVHELIGKNMRYFAVGGSRFDPVIGREFEAMGFTVLQGYGLTETTGDATYTPEGKVNIASVGLPLPGMELKIIDAEQQPDTGPRVGEIAMRGRIVMKGYYKRPEATAEVLKDGWLHTGDLGYIDQDGNLRITGRQKEIIVLSSGKNVYPEELEAHYLQSPLLKEICVLGVQARPGEPASERLHGVIVPNFEELKARRIVNSREALRYAIENLSVQVPSTKRILSYEFWQDGLPRTTTRKIKRFEVEKRVRERMAKGESAEETAGRELSDADREWLADAEVQRALAVVRRAARNDKAEVHPQDNLELDLGLDSMERVELLVALEHEFGGSVDESVISNVYTVRELVDAVRQSTGQGGRDAAPAWEQMLKEEPTDPEVLRVTHPTPLTTATLFLATRIAHMMGRDFFHLKVEGVEKLPKDGPFILAPNHQSFLDAPFLVGALPWHICRKIFYVGTSEIFGTGVWRKIARLLKLIPVDPDANLVSAMQASAYGLRNDMVLVLFPEGERSIDGAPKVFKKGAAILATHLNVPIYPVALDGFHEAWPRGQKFHKFTRARIAIGDPVLPLASMDGLDNTYDDLTRKLRAQVLGMWDRLHEELYQHEEAVR